MFNYPAVGDAEAALATVWLKVSGGVVSVGELTNAGWCLEGYALSIGVPKLAPAAVADPSAAIKSLLDPHVTPHKIGDGTILRGLGGILKNVPWQTLLPILLQLLGGLGGGGAPVSGS